VDAAGEVLVVDGENHRIQRFTAEGRFLESWGKEGEEPGAFRVPVGIAVTPTGDVLVTDVGNRCVHRFSAEGRFRDAWRPTDGFDAHAFRPQSIAVTSRGTVFVADPWSAQVLEFDQGGGFLGRWPGTPSSAPPPRLRPLVGQGEGTTSPRDMDRAPGLTELLLPVALAVDPEDRLLVLDRGRGQARIYAP
jgi:DNA-binding beta-propeller fold protein YncE